MTEATRMPTQIDAIAESWVDTLAELSPTLGTYIGRMEHADRFDDFSPKGHARFADEARRTLSALDAAAPTDPIDEITRTSTDYTPDAAANLHLWLGLTARYTLTF